MTKVFVVLSILNASLSGFSQEDKTIDSLSIKFSFASSIAFDSSHFALKVVYKNNTDRYICIYKDLEEGGRGNRFCNMVIEMEKLNKNKYSYHPTGCHMGPSFSMVDSLRHYDLPKKQLSSYASDTLSLDLLKITNVFWPGKYRFRAHLRVKTIRDDREYNDPNFETAPPEDTIVYISSEWIYFTVKNYIQKRLHTEDK